MTDISGQRDGAGAGRAVDALLPGPGSTLDHVSERLHQRVTALAGTGIGRRVAYLLRGNEWLGHPLHPVLVMIPIGAWSVSGWYDLLASRRDDPHLDDVADAALRVGVAVAVPAAVAGVAQFLDTRGSVRRETAVHAALNNVALTLYLGSLALRASGRRGSGRLLSGVAHGVVSVSGFLGDDLAYRHGVGVRPQAFHENAARHV